MGRYYRRRRSTSSALVKDTLYITNKLPWWGAAILGLVLFSFFYWMIPGWIETKIVQAGNTEIVAIALGRHINKVQYLGIALGLIGAFFTIWKLYIEISLSHREQQGVGLLARILARFID